MLSFEEERISELIDEVFLLRTQARERDAVLRLALEALECHADLGIKADKTIAAIKKVLEP